MTLQLKDLQRPGASLHELLNDLAGLIAENITHLAEDTVVRIHDIRVSTKKIRSLLRLADSEISPKQHTALVACLRDIKNAFSGSRDEDVMRQRLNQIFPADRAAIIESKLDLIPAGNSAAPAMNSADQAATLLSLLATLKFETLTTSHLVENAAAAYRRARKLMKRCEKRPDDEIMHEWRKRVKDVCYHALAFSSLPSQEKFANPLDAVAESLGEYHDLALLGARASGHKKVVNRVAAAKSKVGKRCFRAAKPLFQKPAGKFAKELDRAMRQP